MALIDGLKALIAELSSANLDPVQIALEIRGDSRLVLKQLAGEWKVKNAALRKLHAAAQPLISQFGEIQMVHQARSETVRALGH